MHTNGTRAPRALERDAAGAIADGIADHLEELRDQARDAHAALVSMRPPFTPRDLAAAHLRYHRAELELARAIGATWTP